MSLLLTVIIDFHLCHSASTLDIAYANLITTIMQGEVYKPVTQKQADSARVHERLSPHKTPLMVTSANFALVGNPELTCTTKAWGLGSTALTR